MREIYIRKMRYDEARIKLDREMQTAFLDGETIVVVVHGIGEGKLKQMTMDYVKEHDYLKIYNTEMYIQPNPGVTKVEIFSPDKSYLKRHVRK
jgi:dsDNA-specific endonuclease/ATPase MutS2